MDYAGLRFFARSARTLFAVALMGSLQFGCAAKKYPVTGAHKTFFTSTLPPATLLVLAEQYLEWQKGFGLRIRDHQQGLLVTDWIHDEDPSFRYRVTLRVSEDPRGSLLSSHLESEELQKSGWKAILSDPRQEETLTTSIQKYVENSPGAKRPKTPAASPH